MFSTSLIVKLLDALQTCPALSFTVSAVVLQKINYWLINSCVEITYANIM